MPIISPIRPSILAGSWYPADAQVLKNSVDAYINQAQLPDLPGEVIGIIAPHAGHVYSGPVAGYAFKAICQKTPRHIAIISPMHRFYSQPLLTSAHNAYETPLGEILVDNGGIADLDARLRDILAFGLMPVANDPEHAIEIELPFLQRSIKSAFYMLPVMMRAQTMDVSRALGEALADTLRGKNALLVASSDLSHFHTQDVAKQKDSAILEQVAAFAPEGLYEVDRMGKGEACGLGPMAAVLWAARALGADTVKVLAHATSGDVTGDMHRVVGYGAAVILKTK